MTRYSYDELGNRLTQTDANLHTTSFVYDQLGRRVGRKLPLGQSESYSYDVGGNLVSKTDFNGHTTTYGYDNMNRLTSKTADLSQRSRHETSRNAKNDEAQRQQTALVKADFCA